MNNKILQVARALTWVLLIGTGLIALISLIGMILWPLQLEFMDNLRVMQNGRGFTFTTEPGVEGTPMREFKPAPFYFLCGKILLIATILYLILRVALSIIQSISNLDTFRHENVSSFRKIGMLFLAWMVVDIPSLAHSGDSFTLTMQLTFSYAIYALICFILAEIFSEGNNLMEEQKLTI
jgi:hypothetical protein